MLADIFHFCYDITHVFAKTFFVCTLFFNSVGVIYACTREVINNDQSNHPKNTTWLGDAATAMATQISTWLLLTDPKVMNSMQKLIVEPEYEDKYTNAFDEYMASASASTSSTTDRCSVSNNSILLEHTPVGNVIMKYDRVARQFEYYADRSLTTRQLQSVGRKFIMQFGGAELICQPAVTQQEKTQVSKDEDKPLARGGLAAKSGLMTNFKRQNVAPVPPKPEQGNGDNNETKPIVIDHLASAKFTKRGRISDFSFIQSAGRVRVARRRYTANNSHEPANIPVTDEITNTHTPVSKQEINNIASTPQHLDKGVAMNIDKSKITFAEYKKLMNTNATLSLATHT